MKQLYNKRYMQIALYAFLVIAASTLFGLALLNFEHIKAGVKTALGILSPVIYGFAFFYVMNKLMKWFERVPLGKVQWKGKRKRVIAVLLTVLSFLLIITLLLLIIVPQVISSIITLANNATRYASDFTAWLDSVWSWVADHSNANPSVEQFLNNMLDSISQSLVGLGQSLQNVVPQVLGVTRNITTGFLNFFVGFIIAIYILMSKEHFVAQIKKVMYVMMKPRRVDSLLRVMKDADRTFGGFIIGKFLDSLIVGVLFFIVALLLRLPNAMLVSVIVLVFNMIPYFGPIISAVPGALLILIEEPIKVWLFLIVLIVIQQIDGNIIGPKILGDKTGLTPFWVIVSILIGGGLFGVLGMFLAVPTFAVLYTLFKRFINGRLEKRGLSRRTADYYSGHDPSAPPPDAGDDPPTGTQEETEALPAGE